MKFHFLFNTRMKKTIIHITEVSRLSNYHNLILSRSIGTTNADLCNDIKVT